MVLKLWKQSSDITYKHRTGEKMSIEDKIAKRVDELLSKSKGPWNGTSDQHAFGINVATIARSLLGQNHPVVRDTDDAIAAYSRDQSLRPRFPIEKITGALVGIKSDYEGGYFADLRSNIRSEVEADFLGQALRLLEEKLKDSAAMLIGAVLEDILRQLCQKHKIHDGDGIEKMNIPLRTAGVYGLPQQQQVTAWAAIRNKAAHGRFSEYTIEEIRLMHQGVSEFIIKYLG